MKTVEVDIEIQGQAFDVKPPRKLGCEAIFKGE